MAESGPGCDVQLGYDRHRRGVLDVDASLIEIHSDNKEGTAANTYKAGRFGYRPMFCFADATGETLAALLRAGNATVNRWPTTWPYSTGRWNSYLSGSPTATGKATTLIR